MDYLHIPMKLGSRLIIVHQVSSSNSQHGSTCRVITPHKIQATIAVVPQAIKTAAVFVPQDIKTPSVHFF
jgi:hypothetical protein